MFGGTLTIHDAGLLVLGSSTAMSRFLILSRHWAEASSLSEQHDGGSAGRALAQTPGGAPEPKLEP